MERIVKEYGLTWEALARAYKVAVKDGLLKNE